MKKNLILLTILVISLLFLSACEDWEFSVDGVTYRVISSENKYVAIGELNSDNMDASVFIPAKINGYTVTKIGYTVYMNGVAGIPVNIGKVNRLYFPQTIQSIQGGYLEYVIRGIKTENDKIYCFYCGKTIDVSGFYYGAKEKQLYRIYVPSADYDEYLSLSTSRHPMYESIIQKANVVYYLNFGENDYYYVDYYENSEIIKYIPPTPTRKGYSFCGWFKEKDCVNQWNFDVDTVRVDENSVEVELYAKWVKN